MSKDNETVKRWRIDGYEYSESLAERLDKSRGMIGKMCSEHRPPRMSIPAGSQIEYGGDEDLYICDALKAAEKVIPEQAKTIKRLRMLTGLIIAEFVPIKHKALAHVKFAALEDTHE